MPLLIFAAHLLSRLHLIVREAMIDTQPADLAELPVTLATDVLLLDDFTAQLFRFLLWIDQPIPVLESLRNDALRHFRTYLFEKKGKAG